MPRKSPKSEGAIKSPSVGPGEQALIQEFVQALTDEIDTIKRGGGGSTVTVFDGRFLRQDGPLFIYVFSAESVLVVMDEAPAEVEVGGHRYKGQIVSVQGTEVAVGIEHNFGLTIKEARLITNLWYLLQTLKDRFEQVLKGDRTISPSLGNKLFGLTPSSTGSDRQPLKLPQSSQNLNLDQEEAIRKALASEVSFIWGPPGTGKTVTIGFLAGTLLSRGLRILVVSHTNIAVDNAVENVAKLLEPSELYQTGKIIRFGPLAKTDIAENYPLVTLDKVTEKLGAHLRDQLDKLNSQLNRVKADLAPLQQAASFLQQLSDSRRRLADATSKLALAAQHVAIAEERQQKITAITDHCRVRLIRAESAGTLKRLFLRLNPEAIRAELNRLLELLRLAEGNVAAARELHSKGSQTVKDLTAETERLDAESSVRLSALGIPEDKLNQTITSLTRQAERLAAESRATEQELQELEAKILREAQLIATTLTKATISKGLEGQEFDLLIVDEASMAPMPSLYYALGYIRHKVVIVGDFRQLPPISVAASEGKQKLGRDCPMAGHWLARDIFKQAGIEDAVNGGQQEPRLTMLRFQYRMHPDISAIPNRLIYDGRLEDKLEALPKPPTEGLGSEPLVIYDVSSAAPWSSHLERGSRYNLYSAVVTATLAERALTGGTESFGIITPYSAQARLIKLITQDRGLHHLKISTIHRFQGLEEDIIIFDIAEGPMPRFGLPPFLTGSDLTSEAAKLINVAITRPRAQLVVVAYCDYLRKQLAPDAKLAQVISWMERQGEKKNSEDVVDGYFCEDFDRWSRLLNPHNDELDPNDSTLYTGKNFYPAFFADLRLTQKEIIIVSPFLTASAAQHYLDLLKTKVDKEIPVRVFTRPRREQRGDMFRQAEMVFDALLARGVQVIERRGLHQKLAILDRKVAWEGSLNILSHAEGRTTEHMRRIGSWEKPASKTCAELIDMHSLGSDEEAPPGERKPIQTDRVCLDCGSPMILKRGKSGVFLSCSGYPQCKKSSSIRRGDQILTDAECPGSDEKPCGQRMVVRHGKKGIFLSCLRYPECKGTRNIP